MSLDYKTKIIPKPGDSQAVMCIGLESREKMINRIFGGLTMVDRQTSKAQQWISRCEVNLYPRAGRIFTSGIPPVNFVIQPTTHLYCVKLHAPRALPLAKTLKALWTSSYFCERTVQRLRCVVAPVAVVVGVKAGNAARERRPPYWEVAEDPSRLGKASSSNNKSKRWSLACLRK